MAGSPRKRARRAGINPDEDLFIRSKTERRKAEDAATADLLAWWAEGKKRIDADPALSEDQRRAARRELTIEYGRRVNRAMAKAKRDASPRRLLERDALDEIDRRRRE